MCSHVFYFLKIYFKMYFVYVFWPCGMWDLSSQTRDRTLAHVQGKWGNPNH